MAGHKRNLLETVKRGFATDGLLRELEREGQRERDLTRELEHLTRSPAAATRNPQELKRDLATRVTNLRGLLGRHVGQTRQILQKLLSGQLECEVFG